MVDTSQITSKNYIDGLVQDRSISSALQFCT